MKEIKLNELEIILIKQSIEENIKITENIMKTIKKDENKREKNYKEYLEDLEILLEKIK